MTGFIILFLAGCSSSNPGTQSLGYEGKRSDYAVSGYDTAACLDITDSVPCHGESVVVCCTETQCAVGTSSGFSEACNGTDCSGASQSLASYCVGGDSGSYYYDSGYY